MRRQSSREPTFLRRFHSRKRCFARRKLGNYSACGYCRLSHFGAEFGRDFAPPVKSAFSVINAPLVAVARRCRRRFGVAGTGGAHRRLSNQNAAPNGPLRLRDAVDGTHVHAVDVSTVTPALSTLTASFDAILLFEDGLFPNAPNVGNVVAQFAQTRRPVILATFYEQDRTGTTALSANGWARSKRWNRYVRRHRCRLFGALARDASSIVLSLHLWRDHADRAPVRRRQPGEARHDRPCPLERAECTRRARPGHRASRHGRRVRDAYRDRRRLFDVWHVRFGLRRRLLPALADAFDFAAAKCVVGADQPVDPIALPGDPRGPVSVPALADGALALLSLLLATAALGALRRRA